MREKGMKRGKLGCEQIVDKKGDERGSVKKNDRHWEHGNIFKILG